MTHSSEPLADGTVWPRTPDNPKAVARGYGPVRDITLFWHVSPGTGYAALDSHVRLGGRDSRRRLIAGPVSLGEPADRDNLARMLRHLACSIAHTSDMLADGLDHRESTPPSAVRRPLRDHRVYHHLDSPLPGMRITPGQRGFYSLGSGSI